MSKPTQIDPSNFEEKLYRSGKNSFVKFLAPWCGYCKRLKPTWQELHNEFKDNESIQICEVNCVEEPDLCRAYQVKGYPTLRYFNADSAPTGTEYEYARDINTLKAFSEDRVMLRCRVDRSTQTCNSREREFIQVVSKSDRSAIPGMINALTQQLHPQLAPNQKQFAAERLNILRQVQNGVGQK